MTKNFVTGKVRLSYVNLWEPTSFKGNAPAYQCALIISKNDKETMQGLQNEIKAAIEWGKKKFGSRFVQGGVDKLKLPIHDGDVERPNDPAYANSYYINVKSKQKPRIVDLNRKDIENPAEVYSGCYARVSLSVYPYEGSPNGITCGLINVQKLEDGESLCGRTTPDEDFNDDYVTKNYATGSIVPDFLQ